MCTIIHVPYGMDSSAQSQGPCAQEQESMSLYLLTPQLSRIKQAVVKIDTQLAPVLHGLEHLSCRRVIQ
jgi:hypothetical protein